MTVLCGRHECRCGNVAAILEMDESIGKNFKVGAGSLLHTRRAGWSAVRPRMSRTFSPLTLPSDLPPGAPCVLQVFEAAPQEVRGVQAKRAAPDYFL